MVYVCECVCMNRMVAQFSIMTWQMKEKQHNHGCVFSIYHWATNKEASQKIFEMNSNHLLLESKEKNVNVYLRNICSKGFNCT